MSTMNWKEADTKNKFLMAILACNESATFSNGKAGQVAQYTGCTPKAVTNQLTVLRKELDALRGGDLGVSTPSTPTTASKPRGRKRKGSADNGDAAGEDGNDSPTPGKKAKATPKKSTAAAKKGGKKKKEEEEIVEEESSDDAIVDGENGEDGVDGDDDGKNGVAARKNAADGKEDSDEIED